jgi:hypothetical protein
MNANRFHLRLFAFIGGSKIAFSSTLAARG